MSRYFNCIHVFIRHHLVLAVRTAATALVGTDGTREAKRCINCVCRVFNIVYTSSSWLSQTHYGLRWITKSSLFQTAECKWGVREAANWSHCAKLWHVNVLCVCVLMKRMCASVLLWWSMKNTVDKQAGSRIMHTHTVWRSHKDLNFLFPQILPQRTDKTDKLTGNQLTMAFFLSFFFN